MSARKWTMTLAPVLLIMALLAAGCGTDNKQAVQPQTPGSQDVPDLSSPDGGMSATNEPEAFGDQNLVASANAEVQADDPVANLSEFRNPPPATRIYAMTITWGMLQDGNAGGLGGGGSNNDIYDWSGALAIGHGGIVLRNTIAFEPNDYVDIRAGSVRAPRHLEWVSHTGEDFDGIRIMIYQPPQGVNASPDTLSFTTSMMRAPLVFPVADLDSLDSTVTVDENGNRIRFQAFLTDPRGLVLHGFLRGRWDGPAAGDSLGHFKGVWMSDRGILAGYLRGHFGTNQVGEQVFFGKYIDAAGRFKGFVRGQWGTEPGNNPGALSGENGWFRGHWYTKVDGTERVAGVVRGHWHTMPGHPGYFDGRWCFGCN